MDRRRGRGGVPADRARHGPGDLQGPRQADPVASVREAGPQLGLSRACRCDGGSRPALARSTVMLFRGSMGAVALALSFGIAVTETRALDDAKHPDIRGA